MSEATKKAEATATEPVEAPSILTPGVVATLGVLGAFVILLLVTYWNSLIDLYSYWQMPLYSHGYLVPVFAAVLLWLRWDPDALPEFNNVSSVARWYGVVLLAFGVMMRLASAWVGIETPDMLSMVFCLAGVCLLVGGWQFFKWAGPIVLFLAFMYPLPDVLVQKILVPLQEIATSSSEYLLQTLGYAVERDGNTLTLGTAGNEIDLHIVEACSGLRMLTVFVALCVAVALILDRPIWERVVIVVVGAVPIAVASNIIRISATGMIHHRFPSFDQQMIHDNAGLAMMPVGMLLLWALVTIVSKLTIETDGPGGNVDVLGGRGPRSGGPPAPPKKSKDTKGRESRSREGRSREKRSRRPISPIRH